MPITCYHRFNLITRIGRLVDSMHIKSIYSMVLILITILLPYWRWLAFGYDKCLPLLATSTRSRGQPIGLGFLCNGGDLSWLRSTMEVFYGTLIYIYPYLPLLVFTVIIALGETLLHLALQTLVRIVPCLLPAWYLPFMIKLLSSLILCRHLIYF